MDETEIYRELLPYLQHIDEDMRNMEDLSDEITRYLDKGLKINQDTYCKSDLSELKQIVFEKRDYELDDLINSVENAIPN